MGSDTTGFKAKVKAPFSLPSRKTWKHRRKQLRSMLWGLLSLWAKPAKDTHKKIMKYIGKINTRDKIVHIL